jgi:hypothetical protein
MKLMTKAIEQKIPALYEQESKGDGARVYVKFFTPWSNWTWYATEYDPKEQRFFGLVDGHEAEPGYWLLSELESVNGPMGLLIERDMYWDDTTTIGQLSERG